MKLRSKAKIPAKSTLIWALVTFFVAQFAIGICIDRYGLLIRFPSAAKSLRSLQQNAKPMPTVIAFGSSRLLGGFIPGQANDVIQQHFPGRNCHTINLAVPAGDLTTTRLLLEKTLKLGITPRIALIEISPETLTQTNQWLTEHARRQVTLDVLPSYFLELAREDQLRRVVSAHLWPLSVHRQALQNEMGRIVTGGANQSVNDIRLMWELNGKDLPEPLGHFPHHHNHLVVEKLQSWTHPPSQNPAEAENTAANANLILQGIVPVRNWLENYETGGINKQSLEEILSLCQNYDIYPILVCTPLAKAHRDLYTDTIEAKFQACLDDIALRYPFTFVDYRDLLTDAHMIDNHHLAIAGAGIFTDRITQAFLVPTFQAIQDLESQTAQR